MNEVLLDPIRHDNWTTGHICERKHGTAEESRAR